ncbi:hypothetical protein DIPPA_02186 [Diplonema papillatum]|nr:hypothetical protein DIPPA_02186 [Diplonema papillatum]
MTTDRLLFAALSSLLFAGAASEDCSFDVMNDFRGLDFSVGEIASVESTVYRSESSVAYLDKFASDVQTADTDRSQVMFYRSTSDPDVLSFYWVQPAGVAMQVFISNLPTDGIHAKKDVSHEYEQTFIDPDLSIVVDKGEMLSRSGTFKRLTSQKTSLDRSQGLGNINASEEVLE